jgi:hypothetical protein
MLDEEELSELKAALRESGAVLSDRARLRRLWKVDQLDSILHPAFEATKAQPQQVGDARQLQEEQADGGGNSVETLAIVLTGVLGIVGCVPQSTVDMLCFSSSSHGRRGRYILQARQATMATHAQARLAREAEAAQAAFDIAHQRRESKLKEVDTHLDVSRQLLLSLMQTAQTGLWFIYEWHAEDNPASVQQAVGKKMITMMAQSNQMLQGTPEMVEKLLAGENPYLNAQGDCCSTNLFAGVESIYGLLGWMAVAGKAMCESHPPEERFRSTFGCRSVRLSR